MQTHGTPTLAEEITRDELRALCDAPNRRCPTGSRNRALLAVLYRAGLRIGEALELAPEDVDFDRGLIHVRHSKSQSGIRMAAIDKAGLQRVQHWLDTRLRIGLGDGSHLFVTLDGGAPISSSYVRPLMKRLAKRVGIAKRVHAHALRGAHACELHEEGVPIAAIRDQLGHSNIATTDAYLKKMDRMRIERVHAREWA